jgi:chemotaxis protein CheZ
MSDQLGLMTGLVKLKQGCRDLDEDLVREMVRSVFGECKPGAPWNDVSLLNEVAELGDIIASARNEIAALTVDEITGKHIPSATDELDAIVAHTAVATEAILETCETLDQLAGSCGGEIADALQGATTRIYEACSFQDITGQRITKVVATLKQIDQKVSDLIRTFGPDHEKDFMRAGTNEILPELLNGPQLPHLAMDQVEIDRLLADFD